MDHRSRNDLVAAWLGGVVAALGATVVAGWHLHAPILIQLNPSWVPMQYNTAVCFVALGVGLMAVVAGWLTAGAALGSVPLMVGATTLLTWVFDVHPGIDELLFRHYI